MSKPTLWQHLGLDGKRVMIMHHDDLGMMQAQNAAFDALGFPTGSVMMPTGWASAMIGRPNADLGVHMTLTSEWDNLRYHPLTAGPSLRDPSGHFWQTAEEAWAHIQADEAEVEMRAQMQAALAVGLDVTHIDTHMGTAQRPDLMQAYMHVALDYRVPAYIPATRDDIWAPDEMVPDLLRVIEASPLPTFNVMDGYGSSPDKRRKWFIDTLSQAKPGIYHCAHHAALPTPELQAIRDWRIREADYIALGDPEVKRVLGEFISLTYREVREAMRKYL